MKRLLIGTAAIACSALAISHLSRTWGSTAEERKLLLPGDDHVTVPDLTSTHALSINASPEQIWPWLMQLGQDRSGFYSYVQLENLIGCEITTVHTLRDEWPPRQIGDSVPLAPQVALRVGQLIPQHALVLVDGDSDQLEAKGLPEKFSWSFVLVPDGDRTRLITRERYSFPALKDRLAGRATLIASAIMTEKMLRTIAALSERQ